MAGNRILGSILKTGGGKLLKSAAARYLPDEPPVPGKKNLLGGLVGAVAVRVATRSVPGAIVVGSGLLAKKLYDRRRAAKQADGQKDKPKA